MSSSRIVYISHGRKCKYNILALSYDNKPFTFKDKVYKSPYVCLYQKLFPNTAKKLQESKREFTTYYIIQNNLASEYFEVSTEATMMILNDIINTLYTTNEEYRNTLKTLKNKIIISYETNDVYFGYPGNVYGKTLMHFIKNNVT